MSEDEIIYTKANELTKEIWNTEHSECFGNLELKMQEIVRRLLFEKNNL